MSIQIPDLARGGATVHSNRSQLLGFLASGSMRDLDMNTEGFQPVSGSVSSSHAWVHLVDYDGEINVMAWSHSLAI